MCFRPPFIKTNFLFKVRSCKERKCIVRQYFSAHYDVQYLTPSTNSVRPKYRKKHHLSGNAYVKLTHISACCIH